VTFQTDQNHAEWVFGYYLNNARLRFAVLAKADFSKKLREAGIYDTVTDSGYAADRNRAFEGCLTALKLYIDHMTEALEARS
jgi:hypothetical protein